ncbi:hypothetical protein GCM10025298_05160 [Natronobiforma cellulositropha]
MRGISAATAGNVTLAAIGAAQARPDRDVSPPDDEEDTWKAALESEYDTIDAVVDAFESYADELFSLLVDEGYVDTHDSADLHAVQNSDSLAETDAITVMSTADEQTRTETAVLRIDEPFDGGVASLFVLPEAGRQYARISYDDGEKTLLSVPDQPDTEAQVYAHHNGSGCPSWEFAGTETECTDVECNWGLDCDGMGDEEPIFVCGWSYYEEETYEVYECESGSGERRELVHTTCSGNCCEEHGWGCRICPGGC